jgi:hypothetical protein
LDDEDSDAEDGAGGLEPALKPPAGSRIAVDKFEGGLTIRVPPAGVWKGSDGIFHGALFWNGAMTLVTSSIFRAGLQPDNPDESPLVTFAVLLLLWSIGIGILLAAINMGRRTAMFTIAAGNLLAMQKGIFATKQREWPVDNISSIALGPSGWQSNDRDVLQLQIHASGEKFGLLTGRDEQELEWLASELFAAWLTAKSRGQLGSSPAK